MTQPPHPPWIPPERPDAPGPAGSLQGGPGSRRERRAARARRRRWPIVAAVVASLLVIALGLGAMYAVFLGQTYDENRQTVDAGALPEVDGGPIDVLLLGSDSREGEGEADIGQRSDTMMLVHIPADRQEVFVISILRDSLVDIPGHGRTKVNAAFDIGGYPLAVDTVEQLLGAEVNHLVEIDFQGFRGLTQALGGVRVCNPQAFSSGQVNPSYYPRGPILLTDTAALRYVRERHAFAAGDVVRVQNQQRFVAAAMDRFLSPGILGNPARTGEVVTALSEHVSADDSLTSGEVVSLAWQLRGVDSEDLYMTTVAREGFGTGPNGEDVVLLDEAKLSDLADALARDDVASYLREHDPEALGLEEEPAAAGAPGTAVVPAAALSARAVSGVLAATGQQTPAEQASDGPAPALGEDVCDG